MTGRPLKDANDSLAGGVLVFRDISDSKRIEGEIRRLNEELEQRVVERTASLAEANRELAHKNQENEMFVYSVSHDLRSPLVNLQGFSRELATNCDDMRDLFAAEEVPVSIRTRGLALVDREMSESTRFIQASVMRLSSIIDSLLRLSRIGRIEYQWQHVDVEVVVQTVITAMASTLDDKVAAITVVSPLPTAWGDPTAIEQIFANLIGNALAYLDPSRAGTIELGIFNDDATDTDTEPRYNTYYVRDNGVGIPAAYHGKIFQAFQRLQPTLGKGEGIGLTLIRRIVERHGGRIWFDSVADQGTVFFVTLPARATRGQALLPATPSQAEKDYEHGTSTADSLACRR